jgi:hypothetical protein
MSQVTPHYTHDDFIDFLMWLVNDRDCSAASIIRVVEKPQHYNDEYKEYLLASGVTDFDKYMQEVVKR